MENDKAVLRWMRPSVKQFNIYYGRGGISRYEPDFIVETADVIYMVETKAANEINADVVKDKALAGREYCRAVTEWNSANGGKPWEYALIPHDEVHLQSSFSYLVGNKVSMEQSSRNWSQVLKKKKNENSKFPFRVEPIFPHKRKVQHDNF